MDAARRRVAEVPVEDTVEAGPPGFQALALPSLDDFLAPYIAAEGAANEAYEASKGVIEESAQTLVDRLNRGQEQFVADREGLAQQEAIQRRMQAQELDQIVAPSGLAKELGVDNDIAAEGALLKGLAQMANQSQDEINNNMAESQARGFQSRLEGAESSKAASLATAANTLQALLAQIGVGKADAQREYTSEANRIRATNQQNELAARQQWLQEQEAQRQAEERLAADRQALIDKHSMDAWEAQAPLRRQRNPRAFGFIESVLKNVAGDSRSPQAKQAVLQALPGLMQTARESGQGTFNEQVLRGWIDEYFSGKRILDEEALMRDPAARGLG